MHEKPRVSEAEEAEEVEEVEELEGDYPSHNRERLRAERGDKQPEAALRVFLEAESGRRLERLLSEAEERAEREQELDKERRRLQQEERNRAQREADWKQFMQRETRELGLRKNGQLSHLLGEPNPGEPAAVLRLLAEEDKRQAEEGLVALMSGGEIRYKPLDQLSPEDMPARIAAERLRTTWLKKRQDGWLAQGEGSL
jgi:hypothetical protein